MTNYQVRLICYALIIAAGGITRGIASTAATRLSDEAAGTGTFLMTFGIFFFFLETFALSRKKQ